MFIEANSDFEVLTERNKSVTDLLRAKEQEMVDLVHQTNVVRERASKLFEKCKASFNGPNEERNEFLRNLPPEQSRDELEALIASEQARLELMHEGNGSVIREFEQRKKKIESMTASLDEYKTSKEELDGSIEKLQSEWEPEVDELVQKISNSFSYNMEQISCAGEVGVTKAEDFDQWAIQIRVKFRYAPSHPSPIQSLHTPPPPLSTSLILHHETSPRLPLGPLPNTHTK